MASEHEPEEVHEESEEEVSEDKKPDRPKQEDVDPALAGRADSPKALDYVGDSEDSDQAMLSSTRSPSPLDFLGPRAHLGSPLNLDPRKQIEAVVNEANRHVKMHRFDRARDVLKRLPPGLPKEAKKEIRGQIDRAEQAHALDCRVRSALESAQDHVNRCEFRKARRAVKKLPRKPEPVAKLRAEVLEKIGEAMKGARRAKAAVPGLLARLGDLGVDRDTIDEVAAKNDIDTSNPLQFSHLMEQLIARIEQGPSEGR